MPFEKGIIPQGATPFPPGNNANPNGRPVGAKNRSTIARKILEMRSILPKDRMEALKVKFPEIADNMTVEEIMTIVMAEGAISGDDKAYKAVMDSAYGAPKSEMGFTDKDGNDLIPTPIMFTKGSNS